MDSKPSIPSERSEPPPAGAAPAVNLDAARAFLSVLAEGESVTFQTFGDTKKVPALARILHGDLDEHAQTLRELNERGAGVFVTVQQTDGLGRKAENITGVRALFVDLDGAPIGPVESCGAPPHLIVESSPGRWHAYWLVEDCSLEQYVSFQKALADLFGGDPTVCDLPRVMRLPGFVHRKAEPFVTRVVAAEPRQPYKLADIKRMGERAVAALPAGGSQAQAGGAGAKPAALAAAGPAVGAVTAQARSAPVHVRTVSAETIEDLRSALGALDPDDGSGSWRVNGMRLRELGDVGFELWDEWSKKGPKYLENTPGQMRREWNGFKPTRTGYEAVFKAAQATGWENPASSRSAKPREPWQVRAARALQTTAGAEKTALAVIGTAMRLADKTLQAAEADRRAAAGVREARAARAEAIWKMPEPISTDEWNAARLHPDWIVENYLAEDVALLVAEGGVGKSTLLLYEACHIVLGLPLYGRKVVKPGPVLILTKEDGREQFVGRLREIAKGLELTEEQLAVVMRDVVVSDLTGGNFRLTVVENDVPVPASGVDELIAGCTAAGVRAPRLVVIDPAVSFGVGESRVNDAEQALIEAARRIRRGVGGCCVRYVHHTGKANAREATDDQYSGRGGSAFADGARMVAVLRNLEPAEWKSGVGEDLGPGESGLRLALPKLSYAPRQEHVYIQRRAGWSFEQVGARAIVSSADKAAAQARQVWQLLDSELREGRRHTQRSLIDMADSLQHGLTRAELRQAIAALLADGRVEERQRDEIRQRGARLYLHPVGAPLLVGAASDE